MAGYVINNPGTIRRDAESGELGPLRWIKSGLPPVQISAHNTKTPRQSLLLYKYFFHLCWTIRYIPPRRKVLFSLSVEQG